MSTPEQIRSELAEYGYSDYSRGLSALESSAIGARPLKVAILRSYTVEAIEPVLKLRLLLEGYRADVFFGDYDQYVQEILDPASALYRFGPDLVLLLVRIDELLPGFVDAFGDDEEADWPAEIEAKTDQLAGLVGTLQERTGAQVIVQGAYCPSGAYWGAYDIQLPEGQARLVAELNGRLAGALRDLPGAYLWDFGGLVARLGHAQLLDHKMWYFARSPYRQSAYPALVDDLMRYVASALGLLKKCVVLDLDNTLWGGIVGEDGLENLKLGHSYPGNCYRAFQRELLKLYHRGLILAINSKNNEPDALEVFDRHPEMLLKRMHFAAMRINWLDKASNLRSLAAELNIGLDSMIMLDDNPAECELLRREVPECEVVCLPDRPYLIPGVVASLPLVDNVRLTAEDRRKGAMYRDQIARRRHEEQFTDLDEFLKSLDIRVVFEPATDFSIPRIAQLTQKTNQMNVTTRRYTEGDIRAFANSPDASVLAVGASDKFGDNGIVGVVVVRHLEARSEIDTLLLSCRVIGRGIELAMLAHCAALARERGSEVLIGEFLPTAKNEPAADVFRRAGFEQVDDTRYSYDLLASTIETPAYVRVEVSADDAGAGR